MNAQYISLRLRKMSTLLYIGNKTSSIKTNIETLSCSSGLNLVQFHYTLFRKVKKGYAGNVLWWASLYLYHCHENKRQTYYYINFDTFSCLIVLNLVKFNFIQKLWSQPRTLRCEHKSDCLLIKKYSLWSWLSLSSPPAIKC